MLSAITIFTINRRRRRLPTGSILAAFTQNAIGTVGELRPNTLSNPGYINFDINLQKNFKIAERYGLEVRGSFYNAFNHANLNGPSSTLTSGNFGAITSASSPRVIELGTRITF